ncbi:MAG: hypothetical protein LBG92_00350 [Prevotellaceae bacterium]|jgi:hypothetical protein|nr:hypothetical protein [Prevotellaceae bacterium]
MYDTVNFWIDRAELSGNSPFDILPCLSEISETHKDGRLFRCSGKLKNYSVRIYERGISLKGSLAKFHLDNNLETLNRHTAKIAIEKLSDCLHLDIAASKVVRLDVSAVIQTEKTPQDYYNLLGDKPHFSRLQTAPDTLCYDNHKKQIVFYDKILESKNNKVAMPEIFRNNNLLRYELRYTKYLDRQLKYRVTGATLTDGSFCRLIADNWHREFKTIRKIKKSEMDYSSINTPRGLKEAILATLLQEKGQEYIDDVLVKLKANNCFKDRSDYSRAKSSLESLISDPKERPDGLMQELGKKVYIAAKYGF